MTEKFDINSYISDEKLKEIGHTRETFQDSNLKILLESMLMGTEQTIQDETKKLMKEHSLSYGEARNIAIKRTRDSVEKMCKGD